MHFPTAIVSILAVASFAAAAPAANAKKPNPIIGPFALKIQSSNHTYNNNYISGTHIGAAIDLAVPGAGAPDRAFYLNGTEGYVAQDGTQYGSLHYNVIPNIPFTGGLAIDTSSNVAQLWLSVVYTEYTFSFDKKGRLLLNNLGRWFLCTGQTAYGPQVGIHWEFGTGPTTIKDCIPITIVKA